MIMMTIMMMMITMMMIDRSHYYRGCYLSEAVVAVAAAIVAVVAVPRLLRCAILLVNMFNRTVEVSDVRRMLSFRNLSIYNEYRWVYRYRYRD